MQPLRVLVVDDSALYRSVLSDLYAGLDGVEVAGTASNGEIALRKIDELGPDIVSLDLEMPVRDGLHVLRGLRTRGRAPLVIVVSVHSKTEAPLAVQAMQLGALEFVAKASSTYARDSKAFLLGQIRPALAAARAALPRTRVHGPGPEGPPPRPAARSDDADAGVGSSGSAFRAACARVRPGIVAVALSTGGPMALGELIPQLPKTLPVPVVVAQHILPDFSAPLASLLDAKSEVTVVEGRDGERLRPGTVYIAPGGRQMKVERPPGGSGPLLRITDEPSRNGCRPSADILLLSVSEAYHGRALGVIMTGMGADGVEGLRRLKQDGGVVLAQDRDSCVVHGMPAEAVAAGVVDRVAPLKQIAEHLVQCVGG